MKPRDPQARGIEAVGEAVERYGQERSRGEARGAEPWPGDLYVLGRTADWPVEWLVVERARGLCQVVAADTHTAAGSADVSVPAESKSGPLTVRCAVGVQIAVEVLRRGERVGAVAPEVLAPVRRRLAELSGEAADPRLGAGSEPDPELEDWVDDVLAPARAALLSASVDTPGSPRRLRIRAASAVLLLLLLAVVGVSTLAWRFHRDEREAQREVERLRRERAERVEHPPAPPRPLINLAYANFYPGTARGTGSLREIEVPRQATHLFLVLYAGDPAGCTSYELDVAHPGTSAVSFVVGDLQPLPGGEVSVAIPREQLPDGSYQLRVAGSCGGQRRVLAEYAVRLKEGGW